MDKSWLTMPRGTSEYINGVEEFIKFAFRSSVGDRIKCPCKKCGFQRWETEATVRDHLQYNPFPENYVTWTLHGEKNLFQSYSNTEFIRDSTRHENPIELLVNEAFGDLRHEGTHRGSSREEEMSNDGFHSSYSHFFDLLRDGSQVLDEGSKYSKLEFLLKLYHIKCLTGISDKGFTMILDLLRDAFQNAKLPNSFYEAKKMITKLSLDYTKIDACPSDCMLYWGADVDLENCKFCHTSRWKATKKKNIDVSSTRKKEKKKPAKVLRYFPLKPRLQRLFMCSKIAEHMRWHMEESNEDGVLRHPKDGKAWKTFDATFPDFASDPRNVRLGLASDGFNPFGNMSTNYSIWPVILIPYNLPPWLCVKQPNFILSMIIPGPRMPGNNIDVYLQPLVKELTELWNEGVETFDSSKNETFTLRAALMWTISDFPGLDNLSGWNTKAGYACPVCNLDTEPCRLRHSKKWCFVGHRRYLARNHRFRLMRLRFDGSVEERNPPKKFSGSDIFQQVKNIDVTFGKSQELSEVRKRRRSASVEAITTQQWKKKSIFFNLPYWEFQRLRHNLDVMHIEKNVCDNVLYTLLNDKDKSKDHVKARKDLQDMGLRRDLWPDENGRCPPAIFTIPTDKKLLFLKTLKNVSVPDGYSSNISRCIDVNQKKIFGLKSHDCHIIMEQLLPLAIRNVLPSQVVAVLIELSSFFRQLCLKSLTLSDLENLQRQIVLTLCHIEMLFPPSFMTVMVHLTVHLVDETIEGGPVLYRWMYFVER